MSIMIMIQISVCLGLVHTRETQGLQQQNVKGTYRGKRASASRAEILSGALQQISAATSNLNSAYSNNELQNVGDVAYTIIGSLPVVGDIVSILTSNPENNVDIDSSIIGIHDNLQGMNKEIIKTGAKVDRLSKQLDLSLIQNQVADDVRQIRDCHSNFLLFLIKPTMKPEQERLIKCYDKFEYTREIGNILNDEKLTFSQKPLFDQIIENIGYCNGSQIQSVFKYLLGIYIEGCTATVAAEALKYNQSSTFEEECKRTINKSQAHLPSVFRKCSLVSCENVNKVIGEIVIQSNISRISHTLRETFPWFFFTTLLFDVEVESNVKFYDGKLNRLVVTSIGDVHRVVLWQSFTNKNSNGDFQIGVEYNEDSYRDSFNYISLIFVRGSKRSSFIGFQHDKSIDKECSHTLDVGNLGRKVPSENNTSLSKVAVAMIAIGCIAFILLVALFIYCCRKHRGDDEEESDDCLEICCVCYG